MHADHQADRLRRKLQLAAELVESEPDAAHGLCLELMREAPEEHAAWTLAGVIACRAERYGTALVYFERAAKLLPSRAEVWNNLGTVWHEMRYPLRAREFFQRALSIKEDALFYVNIGVTYSDVGEHEAALKWIDKARALNPELPNIPAAACFSQLAIGDWKNGWANWEKTLGGKFRKHLSFAPDWDGSKVDRLIVYGEQGLGDELMYASCIPDLRDFAKEIVIECDPKLEGLFSRSFPWAEVHGTRRLEKDWDTAADAQVACGSLPSFFRPSRESCPRLPYLIPDPERVLMWRALFASFKKPVIGIAWNGGRWTSGSIERDIGLEAFRPLIESTDAVFVSLQYRDPTEDIARAGLPIREYSAPLSGDYDDTAAMVYCLDKIVGPNTTVHHLAGGMGKPSTILVPHRCLWNYASGDRLPWYSAQTYHRQKAGEAWPACIKRMLPWK